MRNNFKQRRVRIVVGLLVGLVGFLLLMWDKNLLLDHSQKRTFDTISQDYECIVGGAGPWLDANLRLCLAKRSRANTIGLFLRDTRNGSLTSVPAFDALVAASHDTDLIRSFDVGHRMNCQFKFSPDGRWLLWGIPYTDQLRTDYYAIPVPPGADGYPVKERPLIKRWTSAVNSSSLQEIVWLPDSRRWGEALTDYHGYRVGMAIHDLSEPNRSKPSREITGNSYPAGHYVNVVTPSNHLLTFEYFPLPLRTGPQTYFDVALDEKDAKLRSITIAFPKSTFHHGVYPTPDGKHLLWHVSVLDSLPGYDMLSPVYSILYIKPHLKEALWVSGMDGAGMHEIGHLTYNQSKTIGYPLEGHEEVPVPTLTEIEWLPDGKQVQFRYDTDLYRISVNI